MSTFAEHLENVFKPFPTEISPEEEIFIQQVIEAPYQMDFLIEPFKIAEIRSVIAINLNPKKAPGYDLVTGKILKELPPEGIKMVTMVYNAILRLGYFPSQWKVAQMILIQKAGKDATEPASYRPISLLPILSKVFEKLFLAKIKPLLEERHLIPSHQFGFREQHSTVEQVHRVTKKIKEALLCHFLDYLIVHRIQGEIQSLIVYKLHVHC
jgi:Reverse transcriptase (RNA-dependent DNA polymerase)